MTENDFDRIARLWLEDGPTVMSDRALQTALDEVHLTRRRPAWMPAWRTTAMSNALRLAIGAAAVLAVAVIGITVLPRVSGVGVGPAPTPTPIALALSPESPQILKGGAYLVGDPFPIPVTVTVPAGWTGEVGGPYAAFLDNGGADGRAAVSFSLSQNIYADPCTDRGFLRPQPGPTVDDLATALARLPGFTATTPTDVTVDGFGGKQLTLTAPDDFNKCTLSPDGYRIWQLPLGAVFSFAPGERMTLWILDVNGKRLVVSAETNPATTAQDQAAVQKILDSIHIANPD